MFNGIPEGMGFAAIANMKIKPLKVEKEIVGQVVDITLQMLYSKTSLQPCKYFDDWYIDPAGTILDLEPGALIAKDAENISYNVFESGLQLEIDGELLKPVLVRLTKAVLDPNKSCANPPVSITFVAEDIPFDEVFMSDGANRWMVEKQKIKFTKRASKPTLVKPAEAGKAEAAEPPIAESK